MTEVEAVISDDERQNDFWNGRHVSRTDETLLKQKKVWNRQVPEAERQALYQGHQAYLTERAEREAEREAARAAEKAERSKRRHDASPDRDGHKVSRGRLLNLSVHWKAERSTLRHSASPGIPAAGRVSDCCSTGTLSLDQLRRCRCNSARVYKFLSRRKSAILLLKSGSSHLTHANPSAQVQDLSSDTGCRSPDPFVRARGWFLATGCNSAVSSDQRIPS